MNKGFSLVELSIVLVILGLLTGGILAGQSLIRAAELRNITNKTMQYRAAFYTFRDKYFNFPGDSLSATQFWTSAGGSGADSTCYMAQTQSSLATCNGTGDGMIGNIPGANHAERFMSWKHLANAGLVEGSYSGKTAGAVGTLSPAAGTNVPPTMGRQGYFDFFYLQSPSAYMSNTSTLNSNSILIYGTDSTFSVLRPEEAWNIDIKLDDGSPYRGAVVTSRSTSPYGPGCATSDAADAEYSLMNTAVTCFLAIMMR